MTFAEIFGLFILPSAIILLTKPPEEAEQELKSISAKYRR